MSDPKQRAALLKRVRGEHAETVKRTQALLKKQKKVQQLICQNIREKSKTVPEIAEAVVITSCTNGQRRSEHG